MRVFPRVAVDLSTSDVDRLGSIRAAVAEALDRDPEDCIDLDDWYWVYESNAEYDWAERQTADPLTGTPYPEGAADE